MNHLHKQKFRVSTGILTYFLIWVLFCLGSFLYHELGSAAGVQFKAGMWTVEYTRGFVPSVAAYSFPGQLFSALDFINVFRMMRLLMKAWLFEAGYYMTHIKELFA